MTAPAEPSKPAAPPTIAPPPAAVSSGALPEWAANLVALYESSSTNQFILYGNVGDRMILPLGAVTKDSELGSMNDFLLRGLLPRFDVVLSFDLGNGIRVEKGNDIFAAW